MPLSKVKPYYLAFLQLVIPFSQQKAYRHLVIVMFTSVLCYPASAAHILLPQ